jgi:NADPH:quinone reductase
MKAIRVATHGDPSVLQLVEVDAPRPGPGEVVVRVAAIGVNPVDTYIRSGLYPLTKPLPYIPGLDAAGEIAQVGSGVGHRRVGERVYVAGSLSGTYAELVLCSEQQVHPLPDNISFAQGAALGVPYRTAYFALFHRGHGRPGDFLLVHGASGGVGLAAVQLARAAGLQITGTAGSEAGLQLVREQGAHQVLDHREASRMEQLSRLTCNHGYDLILEMRADLNLGTDLALLALGGRVVVIGSRGTVEINPRELMSRNGSISALTLFNLQPEEDRRINAALVAGLGNGTLRPVVSRQLPLAEAAQAHEAVLAPGALGKIVLLP